MELDNFAPIFGEPKIEWAGSGSGRVIRFLFHVFAPDSSNLFIHATDFHSSTWEAKRSVLQLEDMRDKIGVGGSWSEFIDYVVSSIKSEDVKLVLEGFSDSDDVASARLVAQKSKGMPLISISLTRLKGSVASKAMENLSLQLFKAFKSLQQLLINEQEWSLQLTKVILAEKERNESIQNQLLNLERQKLQKMESSEKDKQPSQSSISAKVANRVIPAYRRAKVRGALLQETEDDKDN
ncbi:uncharacterized protein LOC123199445 isoform X1 [Mangifera indica]|uniref:uncharacterized protein LOC123199445 isoform X1 n=1 Tax=Mangifera indica TaxID=29780 RepID=UPI001CFB0622|nr:uncharacterized protein LOC123199445 isoform X1 [Mangifera indica]